MKNLKNYLKDLFSVTEWPVLNAALTAVITAWFIAMLLFVVLAIFSSCTRTTDETHFVLQIEGTLDSLSRHERDQVALANLELLDHRFSTCKGLERALDICEAASSRLAPNDRLITVLVLYGDGTFISRLAYVRGCLCMWYKIPSCEHEYIHPLGEREFERLQSQCSHHVFNPWSLFTYVNPNYEWSLPIFVNDNLGYRQRVIHWYDEDCWNS